MTLLRLLLVASCCLSQTGCGTYIPSQRDWPNSSPREVADMNATLVRSIVCELSYAVTLSIQNDLDQATKRPNHRAYSDFLTSWGVEVATDLTVAERTIVSPSAVWAPISPVSAIFTLGGAVTASSEATNDNLYNMFYPISALYRPDLFRLNSDQRPCRDPRGNKEGSPLVDIDLQILPLLESRIQVVQLGFADAPRGTSPIVGAKNVLTQTVQIKQTFSGGITPTLKFTTAAINPSGTFLSAG
jgi:hypothetical protein